MAALQQRSNAYFSKTAKAPRTIDYKSSENKQAIAPRFIFECAIKLNMKPLTCATAAVLFHRFYKEVGQAEYDEFLIASSSLYLAGKIKDDPIKIRDIINVAHNTLNRGANPLELGDEYWAMRDGIVQAELLITRMLKFDMNVEHPHKYMLHYMLSLKEWFGTNVWNSMPIAKTAASFLHDFHASPDILNYSPSDIAICCLLLTFQIYGVQVPLTDDFDENTVWYRVFSKSLSKEVAWQIIEKIMDVYNNDVQGDI